MTTVPILQLPSGTTITCLFADPVLGGVLIGLSDGRILRMEQAAVNAWMSGARSLYGQVTDAFGYQSAEAWSNAMYRLHSEILRVSPAKEEISSIAVELPSAASARDEIEGVFTTPILWAGDDFGFWESLHWTAAVPAGTEILVGARRGSTEAAVLASPWTEFSTTDGDNTAALDALPDGARLQMRARLRTSVAGVGPSVASLTAGFRVRQAAYFFTRKFVLERGTGLSSGILTAKIVIPQHTEVRIGVAGDNSSDWTGYQVIDSGRMFTMPAATADRLKVGIKLVSYKASATPYVDGFALLVGGQRMNRINA